MTKLKDLVKVGLVSLIGLGSPSYVNAQTDSSIYSNIDIKKYEDIKEAAKKFWSNSKYHLSYENTKGPVSREVLNQFNIKDFLMPDNLYDFSMVALGQSEEKFGVPIETVMFFGDGDNDGTLDYILMQSNVNPLSIIEQFRIDYDKKEIDYVLDFRVLDASQEKGFGQQEEIAEKVYYNITQKEAQQIGGIFQKRAAKLVEATNNFGRFTLKPFDKFIRRECSSWQTALEEGKKGAFLISEGFPFEEYFSDEQVKKINEVLKEGVR